MLRLSILVLWLLVIVILLLGCNTCKSPSSQGEESAIEAAIGKYLTIRGVGGLTKHGAVVFIADACGGHTCVHLIHHNTDGQMLIDQAVEVSGVLQVNIDTSDNERADREEDELRRQVIAELGLPQIARQWVPRKAGFKRYFIDSPKISVLCSNPTCQ